MKQFLKYIFIGTLTLIPLFIVIQLILWIDTLSMQLFEFVSSYTNSQVYTTIVLSLTILILALLGYRIEKAGKSYIVSLIDTVLIKIPAVGTVYSIVKKITALFTPNNKDSKKEVVLVEYPKDDTWVPAYVLNKHNDSFVLFVPTSPNPTSGYTIIVDESKIQKTSLTVGEASQFIISMGADFVKKEEISKIIKNTIKEK
ncbi:MAG: DUF502 domain-containing protein [Campylobacterota bacterium]|nr:DUF502 domain-containing protein [Campylobacterota bacterium]